MEAVLFYIFAVAALISAAAAVTRVDPLMSALWLIGFFVPAAALMALLGAPVLASLVVMVSAGVAMVMAIFVIMLIDPRARQRQRLVRFGKILGVAASGYLAIVMAIAVAAPPFVTAPSSGEYFESPATLGRVVISRYALPFELVGIMLLAAAVAAVIIGRRGASS